MGVALGTWGSPILRVVAMFHLIGCAARLPLSVPSRAGRTRYDVATVSMTAGRVLTSTYALELEPGARSTWRVRTLWSRGEVELGGDVHHFDSRAPRADDPWPLTMQYAMASNPAGVVFGEDGAAIGLVDEVRWRAESWAAIRALDLPEISDEVGRRLVDPEGFLRDLRRAFPGEPVEGPREGTVRLEGVPGVRREVCRRVDSSEAVRQWRCQGTVEGPSEGPVRLHDVTVETRMTFDGRGMVSLEETCVGTLVTAGGTPAPSVVDRPVARRRLVRRR